MKLLILLLCILPYLINGFDRFISVSNKNNVKYHQFKTCTARFSLSTTDSNDLNKDYLSNNMIQAIGKVPGELTPISLDSWEKTLEAAIVDIKSVTDKDALVNIYSSLLANIAPSELDPLRVSAFNSMTNIIADNLLINHPKDSPITSLIDDITEAHLEYIEVFRKTIDDGGSDGYSQSANQEFLCYQFASLIRHIYDRFSKGLGSSYDMSNSVQDLRLNSWVTPVYARLQRRFVRFLASNVEDKMEEMSSTSFDKILEKLKVEVTPRYLLSEIAKPEPNGIYAPWNLASFIIKMLRNSLTQSEYISIEAKVAGKFQNDLANKMRSIGRALEKVFYDNLSVSKSLNEKETKYIEEMINVGHSVVAAVLIIWHIRHNIVGVPDIEGKIVKDYITPMALGKKELTIGGIPKGMRDILILEMEDLLERLKPSPMLESASFLANAIRSSASDNFRALITYNADPDELPVSRDSTFKAVMTYLLTEVIVNPGYDEKRFYENLLSLVALEEAIGVREPRTSCVESYQLALQNAVTILFTDKSAISIDLNTRVRDIEKALELISRLPEDSGYQVRIKAFKGCIDSIMRDGEKAGRFALKDVENEYPWIAKMLLIDDNIAKKYVAPLGQTIFDKTIGQLLMNADLALSMSNYGDMFVKQLENLASDVLMSQENAEERTVLLAGAIFQSIIETSLEENNRMNADRAETLLQKSYTMYRHPLLVHLQNNRKDKDILDIGIKMVTSRLGASGVMELLRFLDSTRAKLATNTESSSGWGSSSSSSLIQKDPRYISFLEALQVSLMKEYSSGSMKRGYSTR